MMIADTPTDDSDRHRLRLASDLPSIPHARRFVRDVVGAVTDDPSVQADLELAASELVTNAIEHGRDAEVDLEVVVGADHVEVMVTSEGNTEAMVDTDAWSVSGPGHITGRGLGIVRAVTDHVGLHRRGDRLTVVARRTLPGTA